MRRSSAELPVPPAAQRWLRQLCLLLAAVGACPDADASPIAAVGDRLPPLGQVSTVAHPAVCRIIVPEPDGMSFGSGTLVYVSDQFGLVITNWHVVRDASDAITVVFPDGFQSGARLIRWDPDWDLAALVIWRPPVDPVPIARRPPRPGEPLTIAGFGRGSYRAETGRCTQYVSPGVNLPFEMVEVSVEARQGDSGGPIFNDRGELAGVLFGASQGTTAGSYAGRVLDFLKHISPELAQPDAAHIAGRQRGADQPIGGGSRPDGGAVAAASRTASAPSPPLSSPPRVTSRPSLTHDYIVDPADRPHLESAWQDWLGHSPLDWAKNALALIGLVSVLMRVLKWLD